MVVSNIVFSVTEEYLGYSMDRSTLYGKVQYSIMYSQKWKNWDSELKLVIFCGCN